MDLNILHAVNMYVGKISAYKKAAADMGVKVGVYTGRKQVTVNGIAYEAECISDGYYGLNQVVHVMFTEDKSKVVILG